MGFTTGTGPFGRRPRGRLNFTPPARVVLVEPLGRRVRAYAGEETIVDSDRPVLVYESGRLPHYAFPADDVTTRAAAPEPEADGFVRVPWDVADRWLEEEDEVIVHPRDPYHRIEVLRSARRVSVQVNGQTVAESVLPRILFETGLPPRYYLPREDVRMDLLEPVDLRTGCAYKGWATYWDAVVGDERVPAVAWSYPEPLREAELVRGLVCFFQERSEIALAVDGERAEAEPTPWAGTDWLDAAWVVRPERT